MGEAQPINQQDETLTNPEKPKAPPQIARKFKPPPSKLHKKPRPTLQKTLPTDRINFSKQLDIIRAYAACGASGKPVTNADVGEMMKMQPSTVSLTNAFLSSIGLIIKAEGGYSPAPEVLSFLRANEWTPETAAHELAPKIQPSWFADILLPKVSFSPMSEEAALAKLSEAAQAGPIYRGQLRILLDYLQVAGLIDREGGQIMLPRNGSAPAQTPPGSAGVASRPMEPDLKGSAATVFSRTTEGAVHFNVSVKVDMKELEGWKPERIAAFFNGIAQVLAAKADIERKAV
jgi:hypothetical protein